MATDSSARLLAKQMETGRSIFAFFSSDPEELPLVYEACLPRKKRLIHISLAFERLVHLVARKIISARVTSIM
jgi:hypothetical protein